MPPPPVNPVRSVLVVIAVLLCLVAVSGPAWAQANDDGGVTMLADGLQYEVLVDVPVTGGGVTALDVAPDGRVFFTEINGAVKVYDVRDDSVTTLATLPTSSILCANCPEPNVWEAGVHGIALAPDFPTSGHLFISYAVAHSRCDVPENIAGSLTEAGETNAGCYHLSRFTAGENLLGQPVIDLASEEVILSWPFSRYPMLVNPLPPGNVSSGHLFRTSAHHGGGITMLPDGSIVIAVGDNTDPEASSGFGPRDPRPEYWFQNAERASQNPADRRGKLLRVNPDGSVPEDNPFVGEVGEYIYGDGHVEYDPYIFAMGMRNPYKLAVDPDTGTVYSGQVGPDARQDDPARGPLGVDELHVIGHTDCADEPCPYEAFNGGYPRCIGPGRPYIEWDYENDTSTHEPLDCSPFDKPVLWYPPVHIESEHWPQLQHQEGALIGGNTITPGVVYKYDGDGALQLPAHMQDRFLLFEWSRTWMATIPVTDDGSLDVATESVEVAALGFQGPLNAAVGPDGAVYVAEFGTSYFYNASSRIGRITCAGCTQADSDYDVASTRDTDAALPVRQAPLPPPADATGAPAANASAWPLLGVMLAVASTATLRRRRRIM